MIKIFKSVVTVLVLSVLVHVSAHAQARRPGADTENMIISAVSDLDSGNVEGARKTLLDLLAKDSENDAAWYYLSTTALMKNEVAAAEEYLKNAVEHDPDNFWYRYRLAGIYASTQRPELAIDMYEKLVEDFPKRTELYEDMVNLYAAQGEYEKALEIIKRLCLEYPNKNRYFADQIRFLEKIIKYTKRK